jgi:CelD/BcsL family acetyltransferase involved in cellulose biosynthesis
LALVSDDAIVAGAPVIETRRARRRTWTSLPFTDALDILGDDLHVAQLVHQADIERSAAGVTVLSFRCPVPGHGVASEVGVVHELPLTGSLEVLWAGFDKSRVRSEIRRAEREGVTVSESDNAEGMGTFYDLHLKTRQRQGVPIQPRRFFALVLERLIETGLGAILIAEVQGRPAAAAILLRWNRTVIYKLAASERSLLRYKPNHALVWHAIQRAVREGDTRFDFGRSDGANSGLRAFKAGWGAREEQLTYTTVGGVPAPDVANRGRHGLEAVIRHSPPFVCRLLGETLYRYAA